MDKLDVIFLLLAVIPMSMAIGAWIQKVTTCLEEIRSKKAHTGD